MAVSVTAHASDRTPSAAGVQAVVAPSAAAALPSDTELHPVAITATQKRFVPTREQMRNARAIVEVGQAMGLPPRAWVIAVATALQESSLRNLGHLGARNDHDSLGLFQQRPSAGWGTPKQVADPVYAATAFYKRLRGVRQLADPAPHRRRSEGTDLGIPRPLRQARVGGRRHRPSALRGRTVRHPRLTSRWAV